MHKKCYIHFIFPIAHFMAEFTLGAALLHLTATFLYFGQQKNDIPNDEESDDETTEVADKEEDDIYEQKQKQLNQLNHHLLKLKQAHMHHIYQEQNKGWESAFGASLEPDRRLTQLKEQIQLTTEAISRLQEE